MHGDERKSAWSTCGFRNTSGLLIGRHRESGVGGQDPRSKPPFIHLQSRCYTLPVNAVQTRGCLIAAAHGFTSLIFASYRCNHYHSSQKPAHLFADSFPCFCLQLQDLPCFGSFFDVELSEFHHRDDIQPLISHGSFKNLASDQSGHSSDVYRSRSTPSKGQGGRCCMRLMQCRL